MGTTPGRRRALLAALGFAILAGSATWLLTREGSEARRESAGVAPREEAPESRPPVLVGRAPGPAAETQPVRMDVSPPQVAERTGDGPVGLQVRLLGEGPHPVRIEVQAIPEGDVERAVRLDLFEARAAHLPMARSYAFSVCLDGWDSDQSWGEVEVPSDGALTLEVREPVRPTLVLVDGPTGSVLDGGEARTLGPFESIDDVQAAPPIPHELTQLVYADADGRARLPRTARGSYWWVGATSHAWTKVRVLPIEAEQRVELSAGGGIRAEVDGWEDLPEARIVVTRPASGASVTDRDALEVLAALDMRRGDGPNVFRLDGLPVGPWKVVVGRSGPRLMADRWKEVGTEVLAGRTTDVRFTVRDIPRPVRLEVDLEISVPEEWGSGPIRMTLLGVGVTTEGEKEYEDLPAGRSSSPWRRSFPGLPTGTYQLFLTGLLDWSRVLAVGPSERRFQIDVPPPLLLRVRVEDEGGRAVSGADVDFQLLPDDVASDLRGTQSARRHLVPGPMPGTYEGRIARAAGQVVVDAPGHVSSWADLEPQGLDGVQEVRIRLERAGASDVRILDEGRLAVEPEGEVTCFPTPLKDDSPGWFNYVVRGTTQFEALPTGTYEVTWRPQGGESSTRSVRVIAGETSTVEFEMP